MYAMRLILMDLDRFSNRGQARGDMEYGLHALCIDTKGLIDELLAREMLVFFSKSDAMLEIVITTTE